MVAVGGMYLLVTLSVVLFAVQGQDCPRPQDGPPNTVLTSADILKPTFPDRANATWECEIGYRVIGGKRKQTCNAGTWSPAIVTLQCERRTCSSIPEPDNGKIEYPNGGNQFGDKAELICDPGHSLVGGQNTISCAADGNWEGRFGRCEVETCEKPEDILNGRYSPVTENYVYGDVVAYKCNKDYTRNGSSQIDCEADGQFRPAPPTCIMVECETPSVPHLRRHEGPPPPYTYKHHVTFRCDAGFQMTGSDSVTCEISGWSPPLPTCRALPTTTAPPRTTTTTERYTTTITTTTTPQSTTKQALVPDSTTKQALVPDPSVPRPSPSPSPPPPRPILWIGLAVSFVVIIIIAVVAYKYRKDKKRSKCHISTDNGPL